MNRTPAAVTGLVLCVLLGLLDLIGVFTAGVEGAPPSGIIFGAASLGLITVAAANKARRGSRAGLVVVVASRAASTLFGLPVYFTNDAPDWARVAVTVVIAVSLVSIALLPPALRRSQVSA
jgi:hypothetical protein